MGTCLDLSVKSAVTPHMCDILSWAEHAAEGGGPLPVVLVVVPVVLVARVPARAAARVRPPRPSLAHIRCAITLSVYRSAHSQAFRACSPDTRTLNYPHTLHCDTNQLYTTKLILIIIGRSCTGPSYALVLKRLQRSEARADWTERTQAWQRLNITNEGNTTSGGRALHYFQKLPPS